MTFTETPLKGAFLIDLEPRRDERGYFARTYCGKEFEAHGIELSIVQSNLSFNRKAGTLRGIHFQKEPRGEAKLVRCTRGAIFYVIVDLSPRSSTFGQHFATGLTAKSHRALFIPGTFANGFQSLVDDTIVEYQMGEYYVPTLSSGYRYDDSAFAISWPLPVSVISARDLAWPPFQQ
ncbi:MAG TPA: dTDP-4-dehydrorhamnose 3,5-epimerase family protein [Chthoniobacterales bacterium]